VDLDEDSLPAEGDLDDGITIDRTKGCYVGQESVAKVRNLGHPTRVVLALEASERVVAGTSILLDDAQVGLVTSADAVGGGSVLLGRVRWNARDARLRTLDGTPLRRR
jgi:folate-binding protein YgfZ